MRSERCKQVGISLLEVLLAIAVTAVLLIFSVDYYTNIRAEQKLNYFIDQLGHIDSGIVNYINSHSGQSLTDVFPTGSNNMTSNLLAAGVVEAADVQNAWFSQEQYQIVVHPQAGLGNGRSGSCLKVEINFSIPTNLTVQNKRPVVEQKIRTALSQQSLSSTSGQTTYINPTSGMMRIQFCAE
ncbi:MAG: hypothetical protein K2Q14_05870 [Gammaproteobacteria bacterium]|nr:hypothetical protein [Gammaproteobacteria bacterium]